MRREPTKTSEPQPQGPAGVWDLRGRRILFWRDWGASGAGVYDRGEGEGIWRSDQHRLLLSLTPTPPILVQIDGGRCLQVAPGVNMMSLYPAGHSVRTAGKDSRYAQVCWSPSLYREIAPDLPDLPRIDLSVAFPDPLISQLARALVEEIGEGRMDRLLADSLMTALAMRVAYSFAPRPQRQPDLPHPRVHRVLEYIDAHLDQDLTLAELADVACLSPCHFSRSFKEAVGAGPQRYTVQRRVERAKHLLRSGTEPLASITAAVGFADQSHFTAAFRRETGTTPGRFRATG